MRNGKAQRRILITGGAGFIGSNWAAHLLRTTSARVHIFDNLSRKGVRRNVEWLRSQTREASRLEVTVGDVRDTSAVIEAASTADEIYHFAAQVAVTSSVSDPLEDCAVNIGGTLNVLEGARRSGRRPFFFFTSTNKVYGSLSRLRLSERPTRYEFADPAVQGVDEETPLDFHSPYGCSKGAADQYVRDYARIYDLPTVVFRMSCIAGPRQFGTEDQGWVAHFLYSALEGRPLTIYGDGRQVRDVLHVSDLVDAIAKVREKHQEHGGEIYNVGGGWMRSASVLEVIAKIESVAQRTIFREYSEARPGDQPLYISEIGKIERATGWQPRRSLDTTVRDLLAFWQENRALLAGERGVGKPLFTGEAAEESEKLAASEQVA